MKRILLIVAHIAFYVLLNAQTTLQPGDVAIVQVNYTYHSFDFVCFVDIEAGTKIRFSDFAYSSQANGFVTTTSSDGIYEYTAPEAIAAGTVIQYKIGSSINASFTTIQGSNLSFISRKTDGVTITLEGENIFVYQENAGQRTYLFAMGWMRKDNFSVNTSNNRAKATDIPSGLSKVDNTVIQLDSIVWGQNATLQRNFRYNKANGFMGTAFMLRRNLAITANYNTFSGAYNNDPVSNFNVSPTDNVAPLLLSTLPVMNANNASKMSDIVLNFDKDVLAVPSKIIVLRNLSNGSTSYYDAQNISCNFKSATFSPVNDLNYETSYRVEIPAGMFVSHSNVSWPSQAMSYEFTTAPKRSVVKIDFLNDEKEGLTWVKQDSTANDYSIVYHGYYDFKVKGIPMRWKTNLVFDNEIGMQPTPKTGPVNLIADASLSVNTSGIPNTITHVRSQVYQNCIEMQTKMYSGSRPIVQLSIDGCTPEEDWLYRENAINDGWGGEYYPQYIYNNMSNASGLKVDSLSYINSEGYVLQIELEIVDLSAPATTLSGERKICRGDSVMLDAGFHFGAEYLWNTNAATQKIWVKQPGEYSVTVKNTLGQSSGSVNVMVLEPIIKMLPDTIYACPGDTVTLVAGNEGNGYFWGVRYPYDTPIRKVTESGLYPVIISNGACLRHDSVRVIYRKGAKLDAYFMQGGMAGYEDVEAQLYKRNNEGKFDLFAVKNMPQFVSFDSLPAGAYVLKAHFVQYTHAGPNPFHSTYHNGKIKWSDVVPFNLTCESDTALNFLLAWNDNDFEFNGNGVISGKVAVVNSGEGNINMRMKARSNSSCNTQVLLCDEHANVLATQCPDANGNFAFSNLPHGNYSIVIERTGFEQTIAFNATIDAQNTTVNNANFVIDEVNQNISQGVVSGNSFINAMDLRLCITPNPAVGGIAKIRFEATVAENYRFRLMTINGQMLLSKQISAALGSNEFVLSQILKPGVYIIRFDSNSHQGMAKLIVE